MKKILFGGITVLAVLLSGSGCRNHIKDVDVATSDYEHKLKKQVVIVEALERSENEGAIRLKLTDHKISEIYVYEVHNTLSRFTPYQGYRELYEVPMGLVLFPVGLASHIVNVFSFGIFPYRWCWYMDCVGLSALNPFLNIESDTRYDEEPLKSRRDHVDTRTETTSNLLGNTVVTMAIGDREVRSRTNAQGIVRFELLGLRKQSPIIDNPERQAHFFVGNSKKPSYAWVISRELKQRVTQGAEMIQNYRKNPTGKSLAKCVRGLENIHFTRPAYLLERNELRKHAANKQFGRDFEKEINKTVKK